MRHDSPQGERIGFWAHLGFAAAYLLAFAWHIKGAREHYRDMQRETPFEHIKRNTGQELYDRTLHDHERLPNRTWAEYNVQYTDLSDFCTLAPEGWWCSRRKAHEGPCAARPVYDAYGEGRRPTLEDLREENKRDDAEGMGVCDGRTIPHEKRPSTHSNPCKNWKPFAGRPDRDI